MNVKEIAKYSTFSAPQLKKKAQIAFNKFIRKRDAGKPCISCGATVQQAGHFYSAGHFDALRFTEDNAHGQCVRCNYYLSGNLSAYRVNLEKRIGSERLQRLDEQAAMSKRQRGKNWDRFSLIEKIVYYESKFKKHE